jgi:hypothetical protein
VILGRDGPAHAAFLRKSWQRDLLPNGIFHAIKILLFSAAAILACLKVALKGYPCPHFAFFCFIILAQTFSPASREASLKSRNF